MRMMSTSPTAKYRLRILSAIKLCFPRLPKPVVGVTNEASPHSFVAIWLGFGKMAFLAQDNEKPSMFSCKTFRHLAVESSLEVDMEAMDGPPLLIEFLDAVADWMA